jgi:hypothetical protein
MSSYTRSQSIPQNTTALGVTGSAIMLTSTTATTVQVILQDDTGGARTISLSPGLIVPVAVRQITTGAGVTVAILS